MESDNTVTEDEEWQHHSPVPESGLCASPWCDDATLPGEEYCRDCIEEMVEEREEGVNPT